MAGGPSPGSLMTGPSASGDHPRRPWLPAKIFPATRSLFMPPFSRPGDEGAGPPPPREAEGRTARQILSVTC
ncbi:MAG: hypothetical protein CW346_16880 [Bacillaceae bacterium]|nr:hypothetical protein [Bacillaceae bacterium]